MTKAKGRLALRHARRGRCESAGQVASGSSGKAACGNLDQGEQVLGDLAHQLMLRLVLDARAGRARW